MNGLYLLEWSSYVRLKSTVLIYHTKSCNNNGVESSLLQLFKVPFFIGQGLPFLWAFSLEQEHSPSLEQAIFSLFWNKELHLVHSSDSHFIRPCVSDSSLDARSEFVVIVVLFSFTCKGWPGCCGNTVWCLPHNRDQQESEATEYSSFT